MRDRFRLIANLRFDLLSRTTHWSTTHISIYCTIEMPAFDIITNQTEIEVAIGDAREVIFTVTSLKDAPVEAACEVVWTPNQGGPSWASLPGGSPLSFAPRESRQVTVTIAPPPGTTAEATATTHGFRLVLQDLANQPGEVDESGLASVKLRAGASARGSRLPMLAAAAVVVGLVSAFFLFSPDKTGGPTTSSDAGTAVARPSTPTNATTGCQFDHDCRSPRLCDRSATDGRSNACRLPTGQRGCRQNEDCVSNRCESGLCAERLASVGGDCLSDVTCAKGLACIRNKCRLNVGESGCTRHEDCVTDKCSGGTCVSNLPGPKEPCPLSACAEPLTCSEGKCLYPDGVRGCGADDECVNSYCVNGTCHAPPAFAQNCRGTCAAGLECKDSRCIKSAGTACVENNECATAYCQGTCKERPGVLAACGTGGTCASGLTCSSNVCKYPKDGTGCTASNQCTTNFCNEGVCTLCGTRGFPCCPGSLMAAGSSTRGTCANSVCAENFCQTYALTGDLFTRHVGGLRSNVQAAECPSGSAASGLIGKQRTLPSGFKQIIKLGVKCRSLSSLGQLGAATNGPMHGRADGDDFDVACADGQLLTAFEAHIRHGVVHGISGVCRPVTTIATGGSTGAWVAVGSFGSERSTMYCSAKQALVGLDVSTFGRGGEEPAVDGFGLRCRQVALQR